VSMGPRRRELSGRATHCFAEDRSTRFEGGLTPTRLFPKRESRDCFLG
jgi:hypothetical protein